MRRLGLLIAAVALVATACTGDDSDDTTTTTVVSTTEETTTTTVASTTTEETTTTTTEPPAGGLAMVPEPRNQPVLATPGCGEGMVDPVDAGCQALRPEAGEPASDEQAVAVEQVWMTQLGEEPLVEPPPELCRGGPVAYRPGRILSARPREVLADFLPQLQEAEILLEEPEPPQIGDVFVLAVADGVDPLFLTQVFHAAATATDDTGRLVAPEALAFFESLAGIEALESDPSFRVFGDQLSGDDPLRNPEAGDPTVLTQTSPAYVAFPAARWAWGPAGIALPIDPTAFRLQNPAAATGAAVQIFDTGMPAVNVPTELQSAMVQGEPPDSTNEAFGGHGLFIAGLVNQANPALTQQVRRASRANEALPDSQSINDAVDRAGAVLDGAVVNFSLGTYTCRDYENRWIDDQGLRQVVTRLGEMGAVVVAAAGNYATSDPFFPAAYAVEAAGVPGLPGHDFHPFVVSVGAKNADQSGRASYSNHGPWVELYHQGTGLISSYLQGVTRQHDGTNLVYNGGAIWSGTSFAAPLVAAEIAVAASVDARQGCESALGQAVCTAGP